MNLVFATHNKNKLKEVQALMPEKFQLISLDQIGCFEEIPETADTIEENAILKANFVRDNFQHNCFADDTGLEVDSLDGAPGVFSARYAGPEKNSQANIDKLLSQLNGRESRKAHFKTVIVLNLKDQQYLFTGICAGVITSERKGLGGFGYDSVFKPNGSEFTFGEMKMEEKAKYSHRGKALRDLIEFLSR